MEWVQILAKYKPVDVDQVRMQSYHQEQLWKGSGPPVIDGIANGMGRATLADQMVQNNNDDQSENEHADLKTAEV